MPPFYCIYWLGLESNTRLRFVNTDAAEEDVVAPPIVGTTGKWKREIGLSLIPANPC